MLIRFVHLSLFSCFGDRWLLRVELLAAMAANIFVTGAVAAIGAGTFIGDWEMVAATFTLNAISVGDSCMETYIFAKGAIILETAVQTFTVEAPYV